MIPGSPAADGDSAARCNFRIHDRTIVRQPEVLHCGMFLERNSQTGALTTDTQGPPGTRLAEGPGRSMVSPSVSQVDTAGATTDTECKRLSARSLAMMDTSTMNGRREHSDRHRLPIRKLPGLGKKSRKITTLHRWETGKRSRNPVNRGSVYSHKNYSYVPGLIHTIGNPVSPNPEPHHRIFAGVLDTPRHGDTCLHADRDTNISRPGP